MVLTIFLILIGVAVLTASIAIASAVVYAKKQLGPQQSLETEVRQAELRRKRAEAELKISELSFRRSQMESNRQIMEATANRKLEAIQTMNFQKALEAGEESLKPDGPPEDATKKPAPPADPSNHHGYSVEVIGPF